MTGGWIGVDLDATLAVYDGWRGCDHVGEPIPKMLARVKQWIAYGWDVRIMTARVNPTNPGADTSRPAIESWLLKHLGVLLPITHEKDFQMIELWDDRAVQVIPNTGERADGKE